MAKRLNIHPTHPQPHLVAEAARAIAGGEPIVYPTDSLYGFACAIEAGDAQQSIRLARQAGKEHFFTLICRDLSELSRFAQVDNAQYRLIKSLTPGPYTFILKATREVPRRFQDSKRKSIGLRIPNHAVVQALITELGTPILSTSVSHGSEFIFDIDEIDARFSHMCEVIIDSGPSALDETTVIDCTGGSPVLVRQGLGPVADLLGED